MAEATHRDPQPGDVLTMRDGRTRTVSKVSREYGGWLEFTVISKFGKPVRRYTSLAGWRETVRVELLKGGRYERPVSAETTATRGDAA